jgi:hypothetical protein
LTNYFLFREDLQSNQITSENISDVIDALQIVKKEQNELIHILDTEEKQIEDELKECKTNDLI